MSPDFRVGGSWHSITRGEIYRGGSWRTLTRGEIYKGGAWHALFTFVGPLTVTTSPGVIFGTVTPPHVSSQVVTTQPVTATPAGGLAPYTFVYSVVSHSGALPFFSDATNATTSISKLTPPFASVTDQFRVTVTDSLGATAFADFSASFDNQPAGS